MIRTPLKPISPVMHFTIKVGILLLSIAACSGDTDKSTPQKMISGQDNRVQQKLLTGRKILYVDSYHSEYEPSIIMQHTAREILESAGTIMQVIYMDAKRKKSDTIQRQAALHVKNHIATWQPDLVIAADDAASKYLVMPYYKDASLPFIFIGVNWDAKRYGYPYRNVTGQVEVELVSELLAELMRFSRGNRIGILTGETLTDKKTIDYYRNILNIQFHQTKLVNDFEEWKNAYLSLQDKMDILFIRNNSGIAGWTDKEAKIFVMANTTIPTGTVSTHMHPWVLISYAKVNREFAEYAAKTAIKILTGTSPEDIPISTNKETKVYLNMPMAKKLNIIFPMQLIERATFTR